MFSIATAPAKQSVSDTISVLSGRLGSATLLEDRRAAILGLRSFAKEYPASVASGALRSLIGSLSKDGEDVDTVKVVLETLLMLFSPNENSPEASEEIALWLADEFTQRQENISLLLDFLEGGDFYSRLYSLQLLSAILSARTERTEECIFNARLGISRLVALLDDSREVIRNEAISLLTYLTPSSLEIQKLVAFENAFDRVFGIIDAEGGLAEGDRIVEDCLILVANLLRLNPFNQTLFRESGCIPRLSTWLEATYRSAPDDEEVAPWAQAQRNRNVYALLAVIRLFLVAGSAGTPQNQAAFWQHGVLYHALQLAFSPKAEIQIKSEALVTCAGIIKGNPGLQENFAQLQVMAPLEVRAEAPETGVTGANGANGADGANGAHKVYVIDGMLDLTLGVRSLQSFNYRLAACECIKAYFHGHTDVRLHFLRRAIEGHRLGADETANVFTTLLRPPAETAPADPYRYWFAAVLMLHLLYENPAAKDLAMKVTEGDESNGEEVVTSIQTITAHLLGGLSRGEDSRISIGYLMLLLCWLFEDLDGVNDFLGEGSNVQGLIQGTVQNAHGDPLVQGLCAMLLGVVYEFSTKDSPIPRTTLQPILTSRMGRDRYIERLGKLRSHPLIRDYEVLPQRLDPSSGQKLPDVFFDSTFVDFFKDNFSRVLRAIDREPGMEISVVTNGIQRGISRELVDSLQVKVEAKEQELQNTRAELESLGSRLGQEQADHRRTKESAAVEVSRIKSANEGLQRHHEEDIGKLRQQHSLREQEFQKQLEALHRTAQSDAERLRRQAEAEIKELQKQVEATRKAAEHETEGFQRRAEADKKEFQKQLEAARRAAESEAERLQRRAEAEKADLKATVSSLEVGLMKADQSKAEELRQLREGLELKLAEKDAALKQSGDRLEQLEARLQQAEARCKDLEGRGKSADEKVQKVTSQLEHKEQEKQAVQNELDDLLLVFGDLEEKVSKYRNRLKALGETVSDGEDSDGGDDDGGDDGDDGDEDDEKE